MSVKKPSGLTADEELERDYNRYKKQFEEWKEQNRGAVGTEAYDKYVAQFEQWEKDVEKRRAMVKKKMEVEKSENDDAAAARAYAQQQEQYLRMHQKGMAEDTIRRARNHLKANIHNSPLAATPGRGVENEIASMVSAMQTVIQSAIKPEVVRSPAEALKQQQQPVMASQSATISVPPLMKAQQPPIPVVQHQTPMAKPVQLWWTRQAEYRPHDRLYKRFRGRAAPTTTKQPINDSYDYYVPGWLAQRDMAKNSLIFPNANLKPALPPHPSTTEPAKTIPSLLTMHVPIPSPDDFSKPPPSFRPFLPPPQQQQMQQQQQPSNVNVTPRLPSLLHHHPYHQQPTPPRPLLPPEMRMHMDFSTPPPPMNIPLFNPNVPPPPINIVDDERIILWKK